MPRIYLTPAELSATPFGLATQNITSQLPTGGIDQILARASRRVDAYCDRRVQAPGTTTLATGASVGAFVLSVASTLTLDDLAEQAAIVDIGNSNQEVVTIKSGGVNVTSWTSPYPGTLTLDPSTPLQFNHSSGAPVQYCYKEVRESITASQTDPYSEALMSQAAQLALAHLPPVHIGLTRISFMKNYPIINVNLIEHAYSYDTTYNVIYNAADPTFTGQIIIEPAAGWLRYRVGTVILPEGNIRATYRGGYDSVPEDVKEATSWYVADAFSRLSNPYMATDMTQGKRRQAYAMKDGKTPSTQMAENLLYNFRRRT